MIMLLIADVDLLDQFAVGELIGRFATRKILRIGFDDLFDLCLQRFLLGFGLTLTIQLAVAFGFFLHGFLRGDFGFIDEVMTLGLLLLLLALLSVDRLGFLLVYESGFEQLFLQGFVHGSSVQADIWVG